MKKELGTCEWIMLYTFCIGLLFTIACLKAVSDNIPSMAVLSVCVLSVFYTIYFFTLTLSFRSMWNGKRTIIKNGQVKILYDDSADTKQAKHEALKLFIAGSVGYSIKKVGEGIKLLAEGANGEELFDIVWEVAEAV